MLLLLQTLLCRLVATVISDQSHFNISNVSELPNDASPPQTSIFLRLNLQLVIPNTNVRNSRFPILIPIQSISRVPTLALDINFHVSCAKRRGTGDEDGARFILPHMWPNIAVSLGGAPQLRPVHTSRKSSGATLAPHLGEAAAADHQGLAALLKLPRLDKVPAANRSSVWPPPRDPCISLS